ncbi:Long chain acyl-CoA synthetase 7, peroxisomal [Vitis vinifera]|uniref:Long chain acyl-CoA synthetase 7, peroxisomal n=1 Tax=Vitis vinifera TaxID=29760 RepID=A0A438F0E2_VITVI|nr:Long chain acyl-CoA synthetase 7, peroxisomal [Vitis vinifera]
MLEMRIVASKNFNCDTLSLLLSFLSEIPSVRLVVVVGGIDEHVPSLPSNSQVKLISFAKLLSQGHSDLQPFCPPKPEDIATICYTSGTTGTPKVVHLWFLNLISQGVILTHGNLIATIAGASLTLKFCPSDIYISYLPLAHIYERANQVLLAYYGGAVGFYQGKDERNIFINILGHKGIGDEAWSVKPTKRGGAGSGLRRDGPLSSSGSANPAFLGCWAVVVRPGFKMGYWVVIPLNEHAEKGDGCWDLVEVNNVDPLERNSGWTIGQTESQEGRKEK